jgi:hypothetical protein
LEDVVNLYLHPPPGALVISVDEKSQIQALERTQPGLPWKKGRCGTMTHDYKRHGTTTLFAGMNVADGSIISTFMPTYTLENTGSARRQVLCFHSNPCPARRQANTHEDWIRFLQLIHRQTPPDQDVHLSTTTLRTRQLLCAQDSRGAALAGQASSLALALHADEFLVVQSGGTVLPRPYRQVYPTRRVPQRGGTARIDPALYRAS